MWLRLVAALSAIALLVLPAAARQAATESFARTIASLSEPGGYFDTDNLISNESSYLQVVPDLQKPALQGGAYVGVGPDQNFTYIAATRPTMAFIVDIRRDNLLLHLLFKALFRESPTRVEYLSMLFGRQPPRDGGSWRAAGIDRLVSRVETAPATDAATLHTRLERTIRSFGVPLSDADLRTIRRFHQTFIDAGPSLRFQSAGRPPQWNYPTFGQMLVDTDASGHQSNFLASEDAFQFVRGLENRDLVIPITGDLAGSSALASIGRYLAAHDERVSAFYVSNVEFYLFREGTYGRFVANLQRLPRRGGGVLVRSIFGGRYATGDGRPRDNSVSELQPIDDVLSGYASGRIRMYADLIRGR